MAGGYYGAGAFLGGLSDGFERGMGIGEKLRKRKNEREVEDAYSSGMEGAKADRENAIEAGISREAPNMDPMGPPNPAAGGIDPMGPPQPTFKVGEQSFGKKADARKASEGETDSVENFFLKSYAPSIKDLYIKQGNLEKAEQFESWMQAKGTREGLRNLMGAMRAANVKDHVGFGRYIQKAYNAPGFHEDGRTMQSVTPTTDDKGEFSGYKIKFKLKDGSELEEEFGGGDDVYSLALTRMDPQVGFNLFNQERLMGKKSKMDAEEAAAAAAEKEAAGKKQAAFESQLRMQEDAFKESIKTPDNQRDARWAAEMDERRDRLLLTLDPVLKNGMRYSKLSMAERKAHREEEARTNGWTIGARGAPTAARPNPAAGGLPPLQPVR